MEPVGPEWHTDAFSSSNEPQSKYNHILPIFVCYRPWIFSDSILRLLVPRGKRAHLQVQTSPKAHKTRFYQFLCVIVHECFSDSRFRLVFVRNFPWTSFKTLVMEPIGPVGLTGAFSNLNNGASLFREANRRIFKFKRAQMSESGYRLVLYQIFSWSFVKTLVIEPVGLEGKTDAFANLSNGVSWSLRENRRIFKFKQAPKQRKFSWTSIKTLVMESVGSEEKTDAFSSSNEP
ncbi:hypothetical protein H5410_041749 [Solanum commersonii]|uniref:Uncharacterized protein n=1 Tax=Solanum commersonii TaxID=4109 RepID=A0A9J5XSF7_SOLCO|nr:hypothetical protein H5410_041749 [Solanum commersonii]